MVKQGTETKIETEDQNVDSPNVDAGETTEGQALPMPSTCEVDAIIRKRVYAAIGVGFVPVPLVDLAALTAVQLELIHALTQAYSVEFKKERVKSILSSLGGSVLSVATVPLFASLFKSLPIIGTTTGAATVSIIGGASTYAIGKVFDRHFRKGGNLLNFDMQDAKVYFKTKLEEGKGVVAKMKPGKKDDADQATPEAEATA